MLGAYKNVAIRVDVNYVWVTWGRGKITTFGTFKSIDQVIDDAVFGSGQECHNFSYITAL